MGRFVFRTSDSFQPSLPRVRRPARDSGASLSKLLKQLNRRRKRYSSRSSGFSASASDRRQLCIVKVRYGRGSPSLRAHLSYIQRKGAGKNGECPELFGNSEKSELVNQKPGNLRHYRLVVSPETPEDFPLEVLAKKLVQRMERDTGYSLSWVGTVHENTEHAHVHLVISGQDKKGHEVVFSRRYITHQMREHTRDILTEGLGDRRPLRQEERLKTEIKSNRFTSLDEIVQMAAGAHAAVTAKAIRLVATPKKANALSRD